MKIYRRDAFLALPAGVVYCKGQPWYFGGLQIKEETIYEYQGAGAPIDWFYRDPQDIAADSSSEQVDRFEEMLASGTSYPMEDMLERDGFYDYDDLFLVYEPDDLRILIGWLEAAAKQEIG